MNNNSLALKAGTWYVISSIIVNSIAILTTPIFTRLMSVEEYGLVSTYNSWYQILIVFCTLNLTYSIGRAKIDFPNKLPEYVGSMQLLSAFVTLIEILIVFLLFDTAISILNMPKQLVLLLLANLFFAPAITFIQNMYRYTYNYKKNIAIAWYISFSTTIFSIIGIIVLKENRALIRVLGLVLPTVVLSLIIWIVSLKNGTIHFNKDYWKYGLNLSLPLVVHNLSLSLLAQSDRIFISKICGKSDTGIYSLVYSYGLMITIITSAISDGWLPWFHDKYHANCFDEIKDNTKKIVILVGYIGLACIAFAPEAVAILGGEQYLTGQYCVMPIVMGCMCQSIYMHYVNIELHLKKTRYVSMGTIVAAIINIVLNYFFIPQYGYIAAAYTTFVSYICLLLIHYFVTRYILRVKLYDDFFMFSSIFVIGVIASIIVGVYEYIYIRYFLVIVGIITFIILFKNDIKNIVVNKKGRT